MSRRVDLDPDKSLVITATRIVRPGHIAVSSERVPAAGHLGVHEVECPEHLLGVDGGYCLHCKAAV